MCRATHPGLIAPGADSHPRGWYSPAPTSGTLRGRIPEPAKARPVNWSDIEVVSQSDGIERIHVSWTQHWELALYVEHYLQTRNYRLTAEACAAIREFIATYPGKPPCTKADMDYYLDANAAAKFAPRLSPR